MKLSQREKVFCFASVIAMTAIFATRGVAQDGAVSGQFTYRGFTLDVSAATKFSNFSDIETSLERQIDIVADSGVRPEIIEFFKSQRITVVPGLESEKGQPGLFEPRRGVLIAAMPKQREPVLLHELLHAFQANRLGDNNPEISTYYERARANHFYDQHSHMMQNVKEYFAVSGSLYLVGRLDQPPYYRERLKQQPNYYAWLGQQFGVQY